YEVHYSLPVNQPPVQVEFLERQLSTLAAQAGVEVAGQVLLCRSKRQALEAVLRPHSLIIVGGRRRWGVSREQKLAQALTRGGHHVIFAELNGGPMIELLALIPFVVILAAIWTFNRERELDERQWVMRTTRRNCRRKY